MKAQIEEFLRRLAPEQGASDNTVSAYRNDLTQFLGFVEGQSTPPGAEVDPARIDRNLVLSYLVNLKQRNYAPATVARKMAALRALFSFLRDNDRVAEDPTAKLDMGRVSRSLPRPLSVQQVRRLLAQPGQRSTPEARRDSAMLGLLYATGLRVSEVVALNVEDVDTTARQLRCRGRGGKDRYVEFATEPARMLQDYVGAARPRLVQEDSQQALFLNRRGERLTRQGFWQIVKGYARAAEMDVDITPRSLRHSVATHLLVSGKMDVGQLSSFLGHANVATTQIYNQLASQHSRGLTPGAAATEKQVTTGI